MDESARLIDLAAARFPNLTRAERVMLEFAQAGNVDREPFAVAGTSEKVSSGGFSAPHFGHRPPSLAPHLPQNFLPPGFSALHLAQRIGLTERDTPPVYHPGPRSDHQDSGGWRPAKRQASRKPEPASRARSCPRLFLGSRC